MHIPDDPLYYEKFYFTPGDLGFKAFDTAVGKIGTLVCWDQWYPEGARITAMQGANVLFYPTAIGWHPAEKEEFGTAQYEAWQTIQRAHAIANGVYVGSVNRVGQEHGDVRGNRVDGPGLQFWGGSFIADPFGRIVAKAAHGKEISWSPNLICACSKIPAATGHFCAIVASTLTSQSSIAFSMPARQETTSDNASTDAAPTRLCDARRVGAPRGNLDRLATQRDRLAGEVPCHSLGLRRYRAPARHSRDGPHPRRGPDRREPRPERTLPRRSRPAHVRFHRWATDRAWTRDSGPIFVRKSTNAEDTSPPLLQIGNSMPGRSTRLASGRSGSR